MGITPLTAMAISNPKKATEMILEAAEECDFVNRLIHKKLKVSYPTLLRLLNRLNLTEDMRAKMLAKRKEKKAAKCETEKSS